ncbi:MAG: M2 family metallopeptidase [Gammaproteobacteria bacterium]|nr:M2 family metallopeptidase [Gammaproteobacteria bacterium]NNF62271.1 M2 family metallopeptidase [Gammaproteobacteria bacterium]NNM21068.1 M2 family metallopeptidase [Gammaproteobacteria bacterium]
MRPQWLSQKRELHMKKAKRSYLLVACLLAACSSDEQPKPQVDAAAQVKAAADAAREDGVSANDARDFVTDYNAQVKERRQETSRLAWVQATYITPDTEWLNARATEETLAFNSAMIERAKAFKDVALDDETARAINLIKLGSSMPAPDDEVKRKELAEVAQRMSSTYSRGQFCPDGEASCSKLEDLVQLMATSRDFDQLATTWVGWRTISPPIRADYQRFAELTNEGAGELGYDNLGAMWRSGYDMSADEFEQEIERLWQQVKPLYDQLHCYVRAELGEFYGVDKVPQDQPIPAHLLGNMWSQNWGNIYPLVEPYAGVANLDVDAAMQAKGYTVEKMVRQAEDFYTSLGMPALPDTFWERSMFTRPRDREVVCHASAWPMDGDDDVRIKMCTRINEEDLRTVFHELGHVYYFLAYQDLPEVYHGGAHDGFHEAVGDTVNLSMTPAFLQEIGLVDSYDVDEKALINQQMKAALDRIAFLPWAKLVDQWRWDVFAGKTAPEDYNKDWWSLRTQYQGIVPPVERNEEDFDPGAKYHIPGNTPYTRYFLSFILQYQFQRALCEQAGIDGPLHECSVYGSAEAGENFWKMLGMGQNRPWRDALEALTGSREMDATAIIDYFAPLMTWLEEKNAPRQCGW